MQRDVGWSEAMTRLLSAQGESRASAEGLAVMMLGLATGPTPGVFEHRYIPVVEYDEDGREVWTPPLPVWTLTKDGPE